MRDPILLRTREGLSYSSRESMFQQQHPTQKQLLLHLSSNSQLLNACKIVKICSLLKLKTVITPLEAILAGKEKIRWIVDCCMSLSNNEAESSN